MKKLIRSTTAYSLFSADAARGNCAHTTLILFPDAKYLRAFLTECAVAFFCAPEGSREALLIAKEAYADCLFFPAAGEKLTADDASRIIDESLLHPVEGTKKLFVVEGIDAAAPLVQNKLLKVLEEPPEGAYFLLGATAEHAVLPTVLSRAKKLSVPPFAEEEIAAALKRRGASGEIAEAAAACGGIYSVAEDLLEGGGEEFLLAERYLAGEDLEKICREIGDKKARSFFAALKLVLRDVMMCASHQPYAARKTKKIRELAESYPAGALIAAMGFADEAEREIKFNANPGQAALALALRIREEKEKWQTLS